MSTENTHEVAPSAEPPGIHLFAQPCPAGGEDNAMEMRPDRIGGGATLTVSLEVKSRNTTAGIAPAAKGCAPAATALARASGKIGFQNAASFLAWLAGEVNVGEVVLQLDLEVRGDADSVAGVQGLLQRLSDQAFD